MITSKQIKLFGTLCFAWIGLVTTSDAQAASMTSIDASDVQHFEQTYEEWVQSLAQSVVPNIPTTVLVEIEYSNNPVDVQTYEELQAANHLPGLPDISDPHFTYPTESPLYALVAKQKVKLIFENALSVSQQKILEEVLNSKLKLNHDRGDSIAIDQIEVSPPATTHTAAKPKVSPQANFHLNRNQSLALVAFALAALSALVFVRKRRNQNQSTAFDEPLYSVKTENAVSERLLRRNPRLHARTATILNPVKLVLKANPMILVSVVRNEKIQTLGKATLYAPEVFTNLIFNVCTHDQRSQIRAVWAAEKNKTTIEQSQFAQTVLAARVYRQMKKQSATKIEAAQLNIFTEKFAQANQARLNLRDRMNQELVLLKQRLQNKNSSTTTTQSEANL